MGNKVYYIKELMQHILSHADYNMLFQVYMVDMYLHELCKDEILGRFIKYIHDPRGSVSLEDMQFIGYIAARHDCFAIIEWAIMCSKMWGFPWNRINFDQLMYISICRNNSIHTIMGIQQSRFGINMEALIKKCIIDDNPLVFKYVYYCTKYILDEVIKLRSMNILLHLHLQERYNIISVCLQQGEIEVIDRLREYGVYPTTYHLNNMINKKNDPMIQYLLSTNVPCEDTTYRVCINSNRLDLLQYFEANNHLVFMYSIDDMICVAQRAYKTDIVKWLRSLVGQTRVIIFFKTIAGDIEMSFYKVYYIKELMLHILSYADYGDVLSIYLTSKYLRVVSEQEILRRLTLFVPGYTPQDINSRYEASHICYMAVIHGYSYVIEWMVQNRRFYSWRYGINFEEILYKALEYHSFDICEYLHVGKHCILYHPYKHINDSVPAVKWLIPKYHIQESDILHIINMSYVNVIEYIYVLHGAYIFIECCKSDKILIIEELHKRGISFSTNHLNNAINYGANTILYYLVSVGVKCSAATLNACVNENRIDLLQYFSKHSREIFDSHFNNLVILACHSKRKDIVEWLSNYNRPEYA